MAGRPSNVREGLIVEATLQILNCHKRFPGVYALKDVSIEAYGGEVVALLGVNGAGKSTLMNILGGVLKPDEGKILLHGREVAINSPSDARACSVAFIQQEVQLFGNLTVFENIFLVSLNKFRKYRYLSILDKKKLHREAKELLEPLGCKINPAKKVDTLSVGEQQMVQIARALSLGAEVLLFDEPTSSLSMKEKDNLFKVIRKLRDDKKTIIYITHYLEEIEMICDKVIIMRDGEVVGKGSTKDLDKESIINCMLPTKTIFSSVESHISSEAILSVSGLCGQTSPKNVSFDLHKGEVLGLWGLLGSGRTETVRTIIGLNQMLGGKLLYNYKGTFKPIKPQKLYRKCGYVTEGRHYDGLFLPMPLWKNITAANLLAFSGRILRVLSKKREMREGEKYVNELRIKTSGAETLVGQLSGGNQQKVVVGKWLSKNPEILILDEPTRGVDVGSKVEIQNLIRVLASQGIACIVISSETEEMQKLADNVVVLRDGRVVAYIKTEEINNQRLIKECIGEA